MRGRFLGIMLIVLAVALAVIPALFLVTGLTRGKLTSSGFMVCEGPMVLLALIVGGVGAYLMMSGAKEAKEDIEVEKEKMVLNMIQTRGKVKVSDIAVELGVSRDDVVRYVYDLVGKKLFLGYVDWNAGIVQSVEAVNMPQGKCPNCGGQLELAGKGTVKCPYCGSEIFL